MISINQDLCVGCGGCARVCPTAVIKMKEKKAKPVHKLCMNCGHCQGLCPTNAIIFKDFQTEEQIPRVMDKKIEFHQIQNLIESNRSIRSYQDKLVEKEEIEKILRVLDHSSSAKNNQMVEWIVISGKEKVEEISNLCTKNLPEGHEVLGTIRRIRNPITCSAPHILIGYTNDKAVKGHDDCVIKTTLATMLMHSEGIGSCFLGYLVGFINAFPELKEHLGLKDNETVYSALSFGYNENEVYSKIPVREKAPVRFL